MSISFSSPGITVSEQDRSLYIPSPDVGRVGLAGIFNWGPINEPLQTPATRDLQETFGKPSEENAQSYVAAADVLSYTRNVYVTRIADSATALNATDGTAGLLVENRAKFDSLSSTSTTGITFIAKYAGELGNAITVEIADENTFDTWEYAYLFSNKPGSSHQAEKAGVEASDEFHMVILDATGAFSGNVGEVLERWEFLSKAKDGIDFDGQKTYFKTKINEGSKYIYFANKPAADKYDTAAAGYDAEWGTSLLKSDGTYSKYKKLKVAEKGADGTNPPSADNLAKYTYKLKNGTNGTAPQLDDYIKAYSVYENANAYDIDVLAVTAVPDADMGKVIRHCVNNIAEKRKDCIVVYSLPLSKILNKTNNEATKAVNDFFKELNISSSYAFYAPNWFLEYDLHTDGNYWVPASMGTAGLMAAVEDVWESPAGYNRGIYKNVIKCAINYSEEDANLFYNKSSANRITADAGYGVVLLGDRTSMTRPSALREVGIRRMLIQVRRSVAAAVRYGLFERNDDVTRNRIKSLIEPFLLQVQAKYGIRAFEVVCDSTNNTERDIETGVLNIDVYILPHHSIQRIFLNFILTNAQTFTSRERTSF